MLKSLLVAFVALAASAAQAAPSASCGEMVSHLDAYLKAHPNATGDLRQSVGAQLMHQPTRESIEKAKMELRATISSSCSPARKRSKPPARSGSVGPRSPR